MSSCLRKGSRYVDRRFYIILRKDGGNLSLLCMPRSSVEVDLTADLYSYLSASSGVERTSVVRSEMCQGVIFHFS